EGWVCPREGDECVARCGDGEISGSEQCDDGNRLSGDGCSAGCSREAGYECASPGETCVLSQCGNGEVEGDEGCDDGNQTAGDGCGPTCQNEPTFERNDDGVPVAQLRCGDGLKTGNEQCDDGNTADGDGCSAQCREEEGYGCEELLDLPDSVQMAVTYRDFEARQTPGGHPDFESVEDFNTLLPAENMAGVPCTATNQASCGRLDSDGKPELRNGHSTVRIQASAAGLVGGGAGH